MANCNVLKDNKAAIATPSNKRVHRSGDSGDRMNQSVTSSPPGDARPLDPSSAPPLKLAEPQRTIVTQNDML